MLRWHLPWRPEWHSMLEEIEEWRVCRDPALCAEVGREQTWDAPISQAISPETFESFCVQADSCRCWAFDALRLFQRNGFVVVRDAFCPKKCDIMLEACRRAQSDLRAHHQTRLATSGPLAGSRGARRWSFGVASRTRSMLHRPAWASLLDCEALLDLLELVLPSGGTCVSSGGDFVEGDAAAEEGQEGEAPEPSAGAPPRSGHQTLHSDLAGWDLGPFNVSFPPPCISANFVVHPVTENNGPMRILPGTQRHSASKSTIRDFWSSVDGEEPQEWRESTLQPLRTGDLIVRDVRVLHGGTPNLSDATRFLPAVEFVLRSYKDSSYYDWEEIKHISQDSFESLSKRARVWCDGVVAPDLDTSWI